MTQNERIIRYMQEFGSITPMDAIDVLGVMRLASRIHEITRSGVGITKKLETSKNRYGETVHFMRYSLQ